MAEVLAFVPKPDFVTNKVGTPYATIDNFRKMTRAHGVSIRYNEITKDIDIDVPGRKYLPDNRLNCCIAELMSLCAAYKMGSGHALKFMLALADENHYNPISDWIESKPWDHVSRRDKFHATLISTDEELKKTLLDRWMISGVAALYETNGISAGGMLVIQGEQYMGKTNWFKNLVPQSQRRFIKDGITINIEDKDSLMYSLSHWLVELGELGATFKKSDLEALKAFITCDKDILRLPYAPSRSEFPRRTVFFGSVDKRSFLTDPAGNRRFWTIECTGIDHTHGLDMQQIWAEYLAMYHNKEGWHLDLQEFSRLTESNREFEVIDPLEERLRQKYNWALDPTFEYRTITQIMTDLGYKNVTSGDCTKCGMIIRRILKGKFVVSLKKINGNRHIGLPPQWS